MKINLGIECTEEFGANYLREIISSARVLPENSKSSTRFEIDSMINECNEEKLILIHQFLLGFTEHSSRSTVFHGGQPENMLERRERELKEKGEMGHIINDKVGFKITDTWEQIEDNLDKMESPEITATAEDLARPIDSSKIISDIASIKVNTPVESISQYLSPERPMDAPEVKEVDCDCDSQDEKKGFSNIDNI